MFCKESRFFWRENKNMEQANGNLIIPMAPMNAAKAIQSCQNVFGGFIGLSAGK
jgi:hypothetical protein